MSSNSDRAGAQAAQFAYGDYRAGDRPDSGQFPDLVGYYVDKAFHDPNTGLDAYALRDNSGNVIVAFRGTEPLLYNDLKSDLVDLGYNQWKNASATITTYLKNVPNRQEVMFAGHSLGGVLAQYAPYDLIQAGILDRNSVSIYTVNALGAVLGIEQYEGKYNASVLAGTKGICVILEEIRLIRKSCAPCCAFSIRL